MKKNELFFPSADKQTNIHMVMWEPDKEVLGVIEIVHGVTEHIMRYEEMANYLTNKGIAVVGIDLLGHGLSTNNGMKKMYFGGVGSWDYVVSDVDTCLNNIKEIYPDVPVTLLGFSLGSFVARTYLINRNNIVNAAVLVGTGLNSNLEIKLAQSVVKSETKKYGDAVATDKIKSLTFDTYNRKFAPNRTDYDWLCSSNEMLDEYIDDPLRGGVMTVGLFREMLNGMAYTGNKNNVKKMNKNMPILLLSGSKDPVGGMGKGVNKVCHLFKSCGIQDTELKIYDGLRHDILHEDIRYDIYEDIYNWMKSRKLVNDTLVKIVPTEERNISDEDLKRTLVEHDEVVSVLFDEEEKAKKLRR